MKKILIINGHPNQESFNFAVQTAYKKGALSGSNEVQEINLAMLDFNPNLTVGYRAKQALEPDLQLAQKKIQWADHIVWIYPLWWGMMPAGLKGFLDRTFLPGFAFKYRNNSDRWDKLLTGRTTEIICTIDYPIWYFKWFLGEGGVKVMRKMVLDFCGLKTTKTTYLGPIRPSAMTDRQVWLGQMEALGASH